MVSLGTGAQASSEDPAKLITNKLDSLSIFLELMMGIESKIAQVTMNSALGKNFVRMQCITTANLATIGSYWYGVMQADGQRMWEDPLHGWTQQDLKNILSEIIDDRFGP